MSAHLLLSRDHQKAPSPRVLSTQSNGGCGTALAAASLLSEVVSRLHDVALPVIQFVPACQAGKANFLGREFAIASAERNGRTLLLSPGEQMGFDVSGAVSISSKMTRLLGSEQESFVPDAGVPGLYYQRINDGSDICAALTMLSPEQGFRMLVLDSVSIGRSTAALRQAAHCHGTIITVIAGSTAIGEIRSTVRQIEQAGGTLLGTVLIDAPRVWAPFGIGAKRRELLG